jgi:predicted nicotinamide N-methyase
MESRKIEINDKNDFITIKQDLKFGYAGEVWDSALVLCYSASLLSFQKVFPFKNKTILEIGSGTGVVGIYLSTLYPKKIILTDKLSSLDLIKINIDENRNLIPKETDIIVEEFNWEDMNKLIELKDKNNFDYIICSDVIYDKNQYNNIQRIFSSLSKINETIIIISFNYREECGLEFFDYFKLDNKWEFKKLPDEIIHEDYKCDDILLLYAKKLKN